MFNAMLLKIPNNKIQAPGFLKFQITKPKLQKNQKQKIKNKSQHANKSQPEIKNRF